VFVIMNFRQSIKQVLARVSVAEKKKDLKVIINFKKEVLPFLAALRKEGILYKYVVKKNSIVLCLKKRPTPLLVQKQRRIRSFNVAAVLYKNPAALIFLSTTFGVWANGVCPLQPSQGGSQLFLTY
jgi:hypothetical protein